MTISGIFRPSVQTGGDIMNASSMQARGVSVGIITSVIKDTSSQRVMVRCNAFGGRDKEARIISPYSDEHGRGIIAGIKKNTRVLVMSAPKTVGGEHDYYVIGFYQTNPAHLFDKSVLSGDLHFRSQSTGKISIFSIGDINIEATPFCTTYFNKAQEKISTKTREHELENRAGWEKWSHSEATDTKDQTVRLVRVKRKGEEKVQYVAEQGHLTGDDELSVIARRSTYDSSGFSDDDPSGNRVFMEEIAEDGSCTIEVGDQYVEQHGNLKGEDDSDVRSVRSAYEAPSLDGKGKKVKGSVVFMEEIAEDGSYTIQIADKATVTIDASNGTVRIEIPDKATFSMDGDDKAITIEQADNGASVRLDKDGNVYITPKSGSKVHLNDSGGTAKGVCRKGDATSGHTHQVTGNAGPFSLFVGTAQDATDTMDGASTKVMAG